jgi:hypothetical protein
MQHHSAHIGWAVHIEIAHCLRRIDVISLLIAVEQSERDQRIEEVARTPTIKSQPLREWVEFEWAGCEFRKYAKLDSAHESLCSPEAISDLKDAVRRD